MWTALAPSSLICSHLGDGLLPRPPCREAPTFLFWQQFSGILSAQAAAGGRNHNACVEGPAQGGVRLQVQSNVLERRKEGRVAAEKKLALKVFLLDFLFARSGDAWGGVKDLTKEQR